MAIVSEKMGRKFRVIKRRNRYLHVVLGLRVGDLGPQVMIGNILHVVFAFLSWSLFRSIVGGNLGDH